MAYLSRVAVMVLMLGIVQASFGNERSPTPDAQRAVGRAVGYLQTESAAWLDQHGCAACHHVAMPIMALSEAQRQGYAIDTRFLADTVDGVLGSRQKMISSRILSGPSDPPDPRPMARGVNMGQIFMAAAAGFLPTRTDGQQQSVRSIADDIVKKQQPDGSWEFFLSRPPINENQVTDTAWILMALQADCGSDAPQSHRASLEKGMAWLDASNVPDNLQMKALRLLLAIRAGKPRETLQPSIDALLGLQQADGGWRQLPQTRSDAFATGQTLYVLARAGCSADQPAIAKGINFLIATQNPDGSWPMTSRGSTGGRSAKRLTPIQCAAASWATLGLTALVPKGP
jgi:hypothetical protein